MACRLIINADDFGWSDSVNEAVALLADEGVVTSTSLMVAGPAAAGAVQLARERPGLRVGLHVAVVCAQALLPAHEIPGLASPGGSLPEDWRAAGFRFLTSRRTRMELEREIAAQFKAFGSLRFLPSHADAHLHLSLNPVVFGEMLRLCVQHGLPAMRVPEDDYELYRRCTAAVLHPSWEAVMLRSLCAVQRPRLQRAGLRTTRRCYGYFRSGELDAQYLVRLVEDLPDGDYELHCHPDLGTESGRGELSALRSSEFRNALERRGVQLHNWSSLASD